MKYDPDQRIQGDLMPTRCVVLVCLVLICGIGAPLTCSSLHPLVLVFRLSLFHQDRINLYDMRNHDKGPFASFNTPSGEVQLGLL